MTDSLAIAAGASAGSYALANMISAIATGMDPTVAVMTYALSIVPHPAIVLAGFLFWKFWLKDYLVQQRQIAEKRSHLLDTLNRTHDKLDTFLSENSKQHDEFLQTHRTVIPRLEEKLDTINKNVEKLEEKCKDN